VAAPQLNFLTLACADVERMAEFLRALGWAESPESEPVHRLFQGTNGIVVALYGAQNYEPHFRRARADGFRGFTLGLNLGRPRTSTASTSSCRESRAPTCSRSRSTRRTASAASASETPRETSGTSPGNAAPR
jgi:hypothetical protein